MNWMRTALRAPETGGAPGGAAPPPGAVAPPTPGAAPPAGGGDAPAAAPGGDPVKPAVSPAPKAPEAAPAVATGYRPEGLPDHFVGATDKETIDKLFKANDGFRQAQAQRGEMPADAKAYDFQPSDVVKPYAASLGQDPFMQKVQEFAFARGIPKGQFGGFINDVLGEMIAGQMVDAPFDADKERAALLPEVKDAKERSVLADRMATEAIARVNAWKAQGMPESLAKDLLSRMDRATTIQLTKWIADGRREAAPALGGAPTGGITQADLAKRQADPRNDVGNAKFEKAFAEETTRLYKLLYAGGGDR